MSADDLPPTQQETRPAAHDDSSITIHLAALGAWDELPDLQTPFTLSCEAVEATWREDLIAQGWEAGALEKPLLKKLRALPSVIFAELSFTPYLAETSLRSTTGVETKSHYPSVQLRWARAAVKLLKQLSAAGAQAFYFDGSMKVFTPEILDDISPKDTTTLLHLFVEVWGDEEHVVAEGLSIFGLPEVVVAGLDPQSPEAQATAFSAAAQMICEGLLLPTGQYFRSSESFPWCEAQWVTDPEQVEVWFGPPEDHPDTDSSQTRGVCLLRPVEADLNERLAREWREMHLDVD